MTKLSLPLSARTGRWFPWLGLLLLGAGFVAGLGQLFQLRFQLGDVYPPYSSFRADPLGTKALYLALSRLGTVRRHFQSLEKLGDGHGCTLFYLGADAASLRFTASEYRHLEAFMHSGGRLVLALLPTYHPLNITTSTGSSPASRSGQPKTGPPTQPTEPQPVPITDRWQFSYGHAALAKDESGRYAPAIAECKVQLPLPYWVPCSSALFFDKLGPAWRVIYARSPDQPVLIERKVGQGCLVLCADAYLLSNQALRHQRYTSLLSWLLGPNRQVIFDEAHLGVSEEPGLATIVRRYQLQGLGVVLLALAGLFVWKNAASFLPPQEGRWQRLEPDTVLGRDMASGFLNLLRRNVRPDELLSLCLVEWKKSCAAQLPRAKLEQVQALIDAENARPPRDRDPVRLYVELCRVLARRPSVAKDVPSQVQSAT